MPYKHLAIALQFPLYLENPHLHSPITYVIYKLILCTYPWSLWSTASLFAEHDIIVLSSPLYSPPCLLFITLHAPNYTPSFIYLSPSTFAPKCNLHLPPYSFTSLIVPTTFCPDIRCPTHPCSLLCSSSKKSITASSCLALLLPLNHCSHFSLRQIFLSNSTNVSFPRQNPLQSNIYCSKSLYLVMSVQHSCTPFLLSITSNYIPNPLFAFTHSLSVLSLPLQQPAFILFSTYVPFSKKHPHSLSLPLFFPVFYPCRHSLFIKFLWHTMALVIVPFIPHTINLY